MVNFKDGTAHCEQCGHRAIPRYGRMQQDLTEEAHVEHVEAWRCTNRQCITNDRRDEALGHPTV